MKEEKITNEDLARMIQDNVVDKMATKDDLREVKDDLRTLGNKVDVIDENVKEINMKIHDIDEYSRRHSRRIEKLEENAGIL